MLLKDAVASLHQEHPEDTLLPLYTPWGEEIAAQYGFLPHSKSGCSDEPAPVWQEYPRPQLRREHYHMLNGLWKYLIVPAAQAAGSAASSEAFVRPGQPIRENGTILVPFSPEALLSGVGRQLQPDQYLWYERTLSFSSGEQTRKTNHQRCLLHFDAVDQQATVYVNGKELITHTGGYLPFTADITEFVSSSPCLLQVRVRGMSDTSFHSRGKQTLKRGGMFYTAQSGIWQSVWYEWVPENHVVNCRITPAPDRREVTLELFSEKPFREISCRISEAACFRTSDIDAPLPVKDIMSISPEPRETSATAATLLHRSVRTEDGGMCRTTLVFRVAGGAMRLWSPEEPYLYPLTLTADEDILQSYFAMRSFTVEKDSAGIPRFCLNHKPYFLHGLLDQGYWPEGLMTAPCDSAFISDIRLAKENGFNMLRKHIKVEPLRWYYHCDRLGMIVWQDMVSGGTTYHMPLVCYLPTLFPHISVHTRDSHYRLFSRADKTGRLAWEKECMDTIDHLFSVPSLAVWVPFNEGWGQFDAARIAGLIKAKDPTRPVDHASGWFDQKGGDFRSIHNYFRPLKVKLDGKRAFVISEYGGFACHIPGHSSVSRIYGYRKYASPEEFSDAFVELIEKNLLPLEQPGLSGAVYTQLSDVEEEVNGLVTYDRRIVKVTRPLPLSVSAPCIEENTQEP